MVTETERAAWKAATEAVAAIEAQRAVLVAPTDEAYRAAQERLALIEDRVGAPVAVCEGCTHPIFPDEPMLGGDDPLCQLCAPTYADLLGDSGAFANSDGDPMSFLERHQVYEDHISAGGKPTDSMAH